MEYKEILAQGDVSSTDWDLTVKQLFMCSIKGNRDNIHQTSEPEVVMYNKTGFNFRVQAIIVDI